MSVDRRLLTALEPLTRRVRIDVTAVKTATGVQAWTREKLTPERLAKHLNGGPARGVCPIKAGESTTMVAVLDFDSHKGEASWAQMAEAAGRVADVLQRRGLFPTAFRSSGGRGVHLLLIWDLAQDAYSVRMLLAECLAEAGFINGTGGVMAGQVEVFPKQDSVPVDGFGNQFVLPLTGHSVPLDPLDFSPLERDPAFIIWRSSKPVPVRSRPTRETGVVLPSGDYERLRRALAAIPNEGDQELGYEDWRNVIFAIGHAVGDGTDEHRALAHEFSARSGKYDPTFLDERVLPYTRSREGGVSEGTIYRMARALGGWVDSASPDDFPVVPTAPNDPPPAPKFDRERDGKIKATVVNTVAAVRRPDLCGMRVAYDCFRDEITIAENGRFELRPMTDADAVRLRMELERRGFKTAPKELARDAIVLVAAENTYDSAQLWLRMLQWDGRPRVETFLRDYMGCEDTPYTRAVSRYMWSALAGRVMDPGVKADMAPIYEGDQGLRKSSAIEALSPAPEYFAEIDLNEKEEDTVRKLRGVLVGEIAELSGLHTRALESIKKFIVRRHEKWVPKYKEFPTTFARRLLFIGTTNRTDILADDTGNRRWLPVHVTRADVEGIARDRDQLWAEGAALFIAEGVCWQAAENLAPIEHDAYKIEDIWSSAIRTWLKSADDFDDGVKTLNGDKPFTTAQVAEGALRLSVDKQDKLVSNRVSAILRGFGFVQKTVRIDGLVCWGWRKKSV